MKIGEHIEGTPEEIKDLFKIRDSRLDEFLKPTAQPKAIWWLALPIAPFAIIAVSSRILINYNPTFPVLLLIILVLLSTWIAIALHIFYEKWPATWLAFLSLIAVSLISSGFIEPNDLPDLIRKLKN